MPACPRCGTDNVDGARFCNSCGFGLERPSGVALHVRKTVTVLFCDVTGSTALGERQDPERLRRVMNRYFEVAQETLERHQGKVEKFIGDAVMAVFGVPVLHEDDALRALRAAMDLKAAIRELNVDLERTHGVRIEIRTGVNSGEVIAGDPTRDNSFVSGDVVVVAERLQRSAAPGEILIGEETYRLARDADQRGAARAAHRERQARPGDGVPAARGGPGCACARASLRLGDGRADAGAGTAGERVLPCLPRGVMPPVHGARPGGRREVTARRGSPRRHRRSCARPVRNLPALRRGHHVLAGAGDRQAADRDLRRRLAGGGSREARVGASPPTPTPRLVAARVAELVGLAETPAAVEEGFWGVRHLLEALARQQPLVVVFDDLNWAEPTLLDLVEHIADWSRDAPILLVAMARPDLLDARPAWGGGKHNATAIFLEPLSDTRVGAARRGAARRRRRRLLRRSPASRRPPKGTRCSSRR